MTTEPDLPAADSIPAEPSASETFRDIVAKGFRATNATLLAPLLLFLLLGPHQAAGALTALFLLDGKFQTTPGNPMPWELMLIGLVGLGTCVWLPVMFFGLPWVSGGAAGRLCDWVAGAGFRPRSYVEHANRLYGRFLVLMFFYGLLLIACYVPSVFVSEAVARSEGMSSMPAEIGDVIRLSRHPYNVAATIVLGLAATAVATVWVLSNAAVAVEDQGFVGAVRRGVTFLREYPRDSGKLYLAAVLAINVPLVAFQQAMALVGFEPAPFVGLSLASVAWSCYASILNQALAISLYVARRPAAMLP